MKKTVWITIIAAVFAVGSAFAKKIAPPTLWYLTDGTYVRMSAAQVKQVYCPGGNAQVCAVDADNVFTIIYRP